MKKASEIINTLQTQPQYNKLQTYQCIDKLLSLLLPSVRRFIKFAYVKNQILFVVLTHNAGKQEFDNNIKMIKDILNFQKPQECKEIIIKEFRSFVTYKTKQNRSLNTNNNTVPVYTERAKGEFNTSQIKDKTLQNIALEIQRIIRERG